MTEQLLTTDEAAAFLKMHRQWLDHARIDGRGPHVVRIGRYCRYRMSDLLAFCDANTQKKSMAM